MKTTLAVSAAVATLAVGGVVLANAQAGGPLVEVYKSPTCGCCAKWVDHMANAGFKVKVTDLPDEQLDRLKAKSGIPAKMQSCHTALVAGFAVEGHVPVDDVKRLLAEKPAVAGIAVPGMPIGSPGMEVEGMRPAPFDTLTFDKAGAAKVFSSHNR